MPLYTHEFYNQNYMCIGAQTKGTDKCTMNSLFIHLTFFCLYVVLKLSTFKVLCTMIFLIL